MNMTESNFAEQATTKDSVRPICVIIETDRVFQHFSSDWHSALP